MKRHKDKLNKEQRSHLMAKVGPKNTKPELMVRKLLYANGFRYRLHKKDLPGSPDIVFPSKRKVIFVHGCFWHRHSGCRLTTTPGTRKRFWQSKFDANVERDLKNIKLLRQLGWKIFIVWGCELRKPEVVATAIFDFLKE